MHLAYVVVATTAALLIGSALLDGRSQTAAGLDAVAFMEGCWRGEQGPGAYMEERYGPALENLMLGTTVYVRDGRAVQHELSEIVLLEDGRIRLTPYPGGSESADPFFLTGGDGEAIFEAPEHDYPKRIRYRRAGDSLWASIDGGSDDPEPRTWTLHRVACDP